jgi:hypothetical protein
MIATLHRLPPVVLRTAAALPVAVVLAAMTAALVFIGWTYVAQPQQRDGVCYESRGRPMPCVALEQHRGAKR